MTNMGLGFKGNIIYNSKVSTETTP